MTDHRTPGTEDTAEPAEARRSAPTEPVEATETTETTRSEPTGRRIGVRGALPADDDATRGTAARVHVVVPAHDEETRIAACLTALGCAVDRLRTDRPEVEVTVTVVLDGCTDGTLAAVRAAASPWLHVLETARGGVGRARALGAAAALATPTTTGAEAAPGRQWLAHTDADSRVDAGWLVQQLAALDDGAHLLVGAVVPDPQDLDPAVLARWEAAHPPGATLGHVHGANLGVRADAYDAIGGFDPVPEHEDVRFVERARELGLRVDATTDLPVVTSGRFDGRTPGGYADHLRRTYGDGG